MGHAFPNEGPISQSDLIGMAEEQHFSSLDEFLQDSPTPAANTTRTQYTFSQAANNGHIIIARPNSGTGNCWALDVSAQDGEWHENASYDPRTGGLDLSGCPNQQPAAQTPGTCFSCGNSTALAGGAVAAFCANCGTPQHVHTGMPGITPMGPLIAGGLSLPASGGNPNRMEGKPTKEVVIPEGMKSTHKSHGFEDALDKMLLDGEFDEVNPGP